ncbi:MAG: hypothetical protein IPM49_00435 [Flavobacteriales bacterium]|nr:hypothetical protein [Flavobacteriales bacterium]
MKRSWSIIVACVFTITGEAQNLVPNGSFEDYTQCPEFFGYAQYATGWLNLHTSSADYFNRCQENLVVGVPFNTCGYQEPADGDGYMGLATTFPGLDWYREVVGIALSEPLQAGVPVCLSFQMALGGFGSWDAGSAIFTSKCVGMRFFNEFPADWTAYLYPNSAALHMTEVPTDTAIWYSINGVYVPDSNYAYLAIGNFFADSLSSILPLDSSGYGTAGISYAFIDDVRVSADLQYCGGNGVHTRGSSRGVTAFPNPFADQLTVEIRDQALGALRWELIDQHGRRALAGGAVAGARTFTISAGQIAQGVYALRLHDDAGAYAHVRLVAVSP